MIHHPGSLNRALPVSDHSWTRCQFQWNPEIICGNSPWWDSNVSTVWPIKLVKHPLLAVLTLGPDPICCRWNASSEEKTRSRSSLSEYLPPEIWSVGTAIYTAFLATLKHQVFPSNWVPRAMAEAFRPLAGPWPSTATYMTTNQDKPMNPYIWIIRDITLIIK